MNEARERRISLSIDGRRVPTNEFVSDVLEGAVRGIVAALKGTDPDGEILLTIKRKPS